MTKERYEESVGKRRAAYEKWWNLYFATLKATRNEKLALEKSSELWEVYQVASREYEVARNAYVVDFTIFKKKRDAMVSNF